MYTIKNKTVKEGEENVSYFDLLKTAVKHVDPREGIDVDVMRRITRVLDAMEKGGDTEVKLEDADFLFAKERYQQMRWAVYIQAAVDLADYLDEVEPDK